MYNSIVMMLKNNISFLGITLNMYGLIIAIGMLIAVFVVTKICKQRGFKKEDIFLVALYAIPCAIVGARLYYVIFSDTSFTFWQIFEIWKGGMAIYGGVIGGALGVVAYCLIHKKNFLKLADIAVIGLILGQSIGRIGCYFADCCYGIEVLNPAFQWFPISTQINGVWHYSTFFYESICDMIIFIILLVLITKRIHTPGIIMGLYFAFYGFVRCIIETFRGDSLYFLGMKVSQLLSLILLIAGIILIVIIYTKKDKKKVTIEDNSIKKDS